MRRRAGKRHFNRRTGEPHCVAGSTQGQQSSDERVRSVRIEHRPRRVQANRRSHSGQVARLRNFSENGLVEAEAIGARIKRERLAANLTQRELAEAVGVGVPHISKVEAGRENPSDELLGKVAARLGIDPDELLLVARRVPTELLESLAASPSEGLAHLRTWKATK